MFSGPGASSATLPLSPYSHPARSAVGIRGQQTFSLQLPKIPQLSQEAVTWSSGLRTPPVEDMSTAYQPSLAALESHAMHGYPHSLAHVGRTKMAVTDPATGQIYRPSTQQSHPLQQPHQHPQQLPNTWVPKDQEFPPTQHLTSNLQHTSRASSPATDANLAPAQNRMTSRRGSESLVYHSLEIPRRVSPTGGNLADFAAQMTCLFWFESADELKQAETIRSRPNNSPVHRLAALAKPHDQFRKWVLSVLSTTQVTQNVILLALLFIYRLKMSSPQVKGRAGSEYRLLVVALMLGNKFLDDNTYTNKTWAEVSSFAVKEIHVMEVEFLSNMRYNLLASKQEWDDWLEKLGCFHEYYERALRLPASPVHMSSPANNMVNSPMHSPTHTGGHMMPDLGPVTPSVTNNFSPSSGRSQHWSGYPTNAVSPLAAKPHNLGPSRKRSFEEDQSEHPAKRFMPPSRVQQPVPTPAALQQPSARLPAPALALNLPTNQPQNLPPPASAPANTSYPQNAYVPSVNGPGPVQGSVSLPPLQPGMRAMSTVYQPGQPNIGQPTSGPMSATPAVQQNAMGVSTLPSHAPMNFGPHVKNRSPGSLAPFSSSPMPDHFNGGSAMHTPMAQTPISNSPSFYLQQRNSPYKPIRHVNTLLYPPPSASLEQYHMSVPIQPTQMHYQPLGRRNDVRTGVVPEFVMYNRAQHPQLAQQGPSQGHYAG